MIPFSSILSKDIMKTKANFSDYAVHLYGLLIIAVLFYLYGIGLKA